jgi:hypothetical protein
MDSAYARLRTVARQLIATLPPPDFYRDFHQEVAYSQTQFNAQGLTQTLLADVRPLLESNLGHGFRHAQKVSLDAGTLMVIESRKLGLGAKALARRVCICHCAGLLHDIKRRHRQHAQAGADYARGQLQGSGLNASEIDDIYHAIRNHEAFKPVAQLTPPERALLSDCLYDADKFRWGPDNFSDTIWSMVTALDLPVAHFIRRFPEGMKMLGRVRATFRSDTGRFYGPQFVDIGLAVGRELYKTIQADYGCEMAPDLAAPPVA